MYSLNLNQDASSAVFASLETTDFIQRKTAKIEKLKSKLENANSELQKSNENIKTLKEKLEHKTLKIKDLKEKYKERLSHEQNQKWIVGTSAFTAGLVGGYSVSFLTNTDALTPMLTSVGITAMCSGLGKLLISESSRTTIKTAVLEGVKVGANWVVGRISSACSKCFNKPPHDEDVLSDEEDKPIEVVVQQ